MATSLSNLVNNLVNNKHGHEDEKCETCELNISIGTVFLNT